MPKGYIAVNDVVGTKRAHSKRPRSKSYTKGSFESIAEEDEEDSEDVNNSRKLVKRSLSWQYFSNIKYIKYLSLTVRIRVLVR